MSAWYVISTQKARKLLYLTIKNIPKTKKLSVVRKMKWSYDELVKLGLNFKSGSTNQKFKTIISDNNTKEINKQILPEDIVNSFKNSEYKTLVTLGDIILYRVYGLAPSGKAGAKQNGSFATTEFAESRIDVKLRLALDPQWKNALYIEEKIKVPKGVVINKGVVGPVKILSGTILEGGADQIILPKNWPESWVVGYRFVTSKPLLAYPEYTVENPDKTRKIHSE